MDAHVFRRFCQNLAPLLLGARLEKIQSPAENIFVFTLYAQQKKRHLVLKIGRQQPFIYFADERPVAAAPPSAMVMRWRKYCSGRRIALCTYHWTERKIYLLFRGASSETLPQMAPPQTWLVLDLREGPKLFLEKSPPHILDMPNELEACTKQEGLAFCPNEIVPNEKWPKAHELHEACEDWRHWPVITPALRRILPLLDPLDGQALLLDLEMGGGDLYVYGQHEQDEQAEISAWPLLPSQTKQKEERIFEDPFEATSFVGNALVLGAAASKQREEAANPQKREAKRLQKLLEKLNTEEERLHNMLQGQEQALRIQGMLWQLPHDAKLAELHTEEGIIPLDPRYTVRENMQNLFHKASRGKRGLVFLEKRRNTLLSQWQSVQNAALTIAAGGQLAQGKSTTKQSKNKEKNATGNLALPPLPKGVQAFKSSDGFIILRGKDSKGNWAALRAAHAQDIWLHVEGGPGSHCIIRRHFAGQEIPERTLHEAASLAAVKSWQKDNPTAHILCAQVRHVKPMRNAPQGTVRIDKALDTFRVDIISNIEELIA